MRWHWAVIPSDQIELGHVNQALSLSMAEVPGMQRVQLAGANQCSGNSWLAVPAADSRRPMGKRGDGKCRARIRLRDVLRLNEGGLLRDGMQHCFERAARPHTALAQDAHAGDIRRGRLARTYLSPTGSGPEGSSPNEPDAGCRPASHRDGSAVSIQTSGLSFRGL